MEEHVPVIFLDLDSEWRRVDVFVCVTCVVTCRVFAADSMTTPLAREGFEAAGINSILPKEHGAKFFVLPVVRSDDVSDAVRACVVSWDSSIHDSLHLNRVTPTNERVYLIVKVRRRHILFPVDFIITYDVTRRWLRALLTLQRWRWC